MPATRDRAAPNESPLGRQRWIQLVVPSTLTSRSGSRWPAKPISLHRKSPIVGALNCGLQLVQLRHDHRGSIAPSDVRKVAFATPCCRHPIAAADPRTTFFIVAPPFRSTAAKQPTLRGHPAPTLAPCAGTQIARCVCLKGHQGKCQRPPITRKRKPRLAQWSKQGDRGLTGLSYPRS